MQFTILGCGGSMGIPAIGCRCAVCSSADSRNVRTRTAAMLQHDDTTILIDCGPDMRQQLLRANIRNLDAILVTHPHQDHIGGLDDVRPLTLKRETPLPLYGLPFTLERIRYQYDYAFQPEPSPSTRPNIELNVLDDQPFSINGITITPLPICHGDWQIFGFRIGDLAYMTDVSMIPDATYERLRNVKTLVIGALRYNPHPLHFTVAQALAEIERIQPERAFFVHMGHDLDYEATNAELPNHVQLAYDGLTIGVGLEAKG